MAISDMVAFAELPEDVRQDMTLYTGCMTGASSVQDVKDMLKQQGFIEIRATQKDESKTFIRSWAPGTDVKAMYESVKDGFVDSDWKDTILVMPGEKVTVLKPFNEGVRIFV